MSESYNKYAIEIISASCSGNSDPNASKPNCLNCLNRPFCGGGRYDYLVEELGGSDTPAIGFAAGLERLMIASNINDNNIIKNPDVYIIAVEDKAIEIALNLANELRIKKDIIVINDTLKRSLKAQMKDANRLKAKYSIIIGEEELKRKIVSIKNMETGNQEELSIDKIIDYF